MIAHTALDAGIGARSSLLCARHRQPKLPYAYELRSRTRPHSTVECRCSQCFERQRSCFPQCWMPHVATCATHLARNCVCSAVTRSTMPLCSAAVPCALQGLASRLCLGGSGRARASIARSTHAQHGSTQRASQRDVKHASSGISAGKVAARRRRRNRAAPEPFRLPAWLLSILMRSGGRQGTTQNGRK